MYVIETTVLDEVALAVQKCFQWIQAALDTLDFISENPEDERLGLDAFNESLDTLDSWDSFLDSISRLSEIAGRGGADNLLRQEVRNNVLNIQNADQLYYYMEVMVVGVDTTVQKTQELVSELKFKAEPYFDSSPEAVFKKKDELVDLLVSTIHKKEITNESEELALLTVARLHFLEFFVSVENLLYVLTLLGILNPPAEILSTEEEPTDDPKYKELLDIFKNPAEMDICVNALRSIDPAVINDAGEWIGKKRGKHASISILVAWVDVLETRAKIWPGIDRLLLIKLLNKHFLGLNMGERTPGMFDKPSEIQSQYTTDFLELIKK